jgi:hypothetical protein
MGCKLFWCWEARDGMDWLDIQKIEAKTTWTRGRVLSNPWRPMQEKTDISVGLFYLCIYVLVFLINKDCVFHFPLGLGFTFPIMHVCFSFSFPIRIFLVISFSFSFSLLN